MGADPETLITLYKSYVRAIMDYGIFIYYPTTTKMMAKLEGVQFIAIRYALGFRNSTPTNILLSESKLSLIRERAKFLALNFLIKIYTNNNSNVFQMINKCQYKSSNI